MQAELPLFPEPASTRRAEVDALFLFLVGVSAVFSLLISGAGRLLRVALPPPRRRAAAAQIHGSVRPRDRPGPSIPLALVAGDVLLGRAGLLRRLPAARATRCEIYVVGKQWMWKIQHPTGQREINELHVPRRACRSS